MEYVLHLVVFVLIYGMVALGLNVSSGFTQLISLAQAGFFGVGAYTAAILATQFGSSFWLNLPLGMLATCLVALPVGLIALRTVGDYFIICTLGASIILTSVMNNWFDLTRGPLGIFGIPPVSLFGHALLAKWEWVLLAGVVYALLFWLSWNLKRSALGRLLVSIGEDEIFCQSLGKNVGLCKVESFVFGAVLAAIPGVLYAHYVSFIDPSSFSVKESIFILSIIIVGGIGNLAGSLGAAAFLVLLPEALRFVGLPADVAGNLRQIIYGLILVVVIVLQRRMRALAERGR